MNWQSDFVTPHHLNKRPHSPNANITNAHITSPTPSIANSNSHHLFANSSNYNRILASGGGGGGGSGDGGGGRDDYYGSSSYHQYSVPSSSSNISNTILLNSYAPINSTNTVNYPSYLPSPIVPILNLPSESSSSSSSSSSSNNNNNNFNSQTNVFTSLNSSSSSLATKNLVAQIIDLIKHLNIKLIAFDFDCTIVTIHTGGQWIDSPDKLAEFVRPCFRSLLPALLQCADLFVCVVTYSPQEQLIREVLRISMKDENMV